jgi:predicted nucleic acid-binding protein
MLVDWTGRASNAGVAVGVGDLLVAAIAAENAAPVWSLDSAFDRLEQLRLISQYEPNTGRPL